MGEYSLARRVIDCNLRLIRRLVLSCWRNLNQQDFITSFIAIQIVIVSGLILVQMMGCFYLSEARVIALSLIY
ncbi:hypothetical protein FHR25_001935 [Yokenella regensburgei]|nr:hypothetical protein FHR25_001935 [Yokenella regensburgei]